MGKQCVNVTQAVKTAMDVVMRVMMQQKKLAETAVTGFIVSRQHSSMHDPASPTKMVDL